MKLNKGEILDAVKQFEGKDIEEIMKDFYPDLALMPSEVLPWQIVQMFILVIRTANAFAITREEARDLIRLTLELSKADLAYKLMDEMNDLIARTQETLRDYEVYLQYLTNLGD